MNAENTVHGERGSSRWASPLVEDRALTIDGGVISVRLYRTRARGKAGVLVYLSGDDAELAALADQAQCLVVSLQPGARNEDARRVLDWLRANARKFGADGSRLALGATGDAARDALAIAPATTGSLALLLLRSPHFDLAAIEPARLPSTYIEAQVQGADRKAIFDFAKAALAADVELELHLGDEAPDVSLAAGALKRALKAPPKKKSIVPLIVTVLGSASAFGVSTYLGADLPAALGQATIALVAPLTLQALWARWRGRG